MTPDDKQNFRIMFTAVALLGLIIRAEEHGDVNDTPTDAVRLADETLAKLDAEPTP